MSADWEERLGRLWDSFDDYGEEEFLAAMDELVAELPADSAVALYERGSAFDSTGHEQEAVALYRQALERGLGPDRRRQCVIQLASSLRNVGQPAEGAALLEAELEKGSDELDDGLRAFLALTLVDSGREREAVGVALTALAGHMTRYRRSLENYARGLSG